MTATASWQQAARHLALDSAALVVIAAFRAEHLDALLMKGPVTASRLYAAEPHRRFYGDVDLLVAPADFAAAQRVLARRGYRPYDVGFRASERAWHETVWLGDGLLGSDARPLEIDLHRSLAWVGDPEALWRLLWRSRESITLQGKAVAAPSRVGTALIVALHAARPGPGQQPYRDLSQAVQVFDAAEWRAAVELARECDALTAFAFGLGSVPAGRALLDELALDERGTTAHPSTAMRLYGPGQSPAGAAMGLLLQAGSTRARLRHVVDRMFPSAAYVRVHWPVARTGRWGLVRGYLQCWVRLARMAPRGVLELRQVRRAAGADRWGLDALTTVRRQLAQGGLDQVELPEPDRSLTGRALDRVLDRQSASCLERALIRQRFAAAHGRERELVIGVSPPGEHFHAHAWLAGDEQRDEDLHELLRRPVPVHWLGPSDG